MWRSTISMIRVLVVAVDIEKNKDNNTRDKLQGYLILSFPI